MGDDYEAGHDQLREDREDGDTRSQGELRGAGTDAAAAARRHDGDFSAHLASLITEAEGMTQRAAARDAERLAPAGERTIARPPAAERRSSDAPEPPSPNHPAAELQWLEVEQRMIARALDEAGIDHSKRTIEMIAYDASDRRAVDIALRAMDALYEGGATG